MSQSSLTSPVSRRTVIAGAGAIGLALATFRLAAAQDATPDAMTGHPAVGTWQWVNYPDTPESDITFSILFADGTYVDLSADRYVGVGEWRPTGERTAELITVNTVLAPLDTLFGEGPVVIPADLLERGERTLYRVTIDIDETGNHFSSTGTAETQDATGAIVTTVPYNGNGDRMALTGAGMATPTA